MKTIKCSKVVVYRKHPKRENELSKKVIEAVCDFLENSNINYEICIIRNDEKRMGDHYIPGEIGIVYGIPKYVRKDYLGMKKLFELQNNMIVIERGYIKRDKYHSIGWNGMNGYANFLNKDMPDNRFKIRVALKELRERGAIYDYPVLKETAAGLISQSEHTLIIKDEPIVTTKL